MRQLRTGIAVIAGLAALAAAIYFGVPRAPQTPAPPKRQLPQLRAEQTPAGKPAGVPPANTLRIHKSVVDFRKSFAESTNYWDYAHQVLPAARAGNADAQFYLSRILEFCDYANKSFFQFNGAPLTLDEALQLAAKRKRSLDVTQVVFDRCHDFFQGRDASELGSSLDWLVKAAKAGQPVAQAITAQKMFWQELLKTYLRAGAAQTPENSAPPIAGGTDPHELLLGAVKSLDPEALFMVGLAQGSREQLYPSRYGKGTNQLAWMLVACQRGFDCSGSPDWITTGCPNCGTRNPAARTPSDAFMTLAGDDWPAVQQRAQEIQDKLNSGQWDELGLGS